MTVDDDMLKALASPLAAYMYARDVIKDRFELGEPMIAAGVFGHIIMPVVSLRNGLSWVNKKLLRMHIMHLLMSGMSSRKDLNSVNLLSLRMLSGHISMPLISSREDLSSVRKLSWRIIMCIAIIKNSSRINNEACTSP
jgi:hypothetical protein